MINDDHSLSVDDAAQHLGVSPATIRRRIKDRKVAAFQRPTERGFEWRILPAQPLDNVEHNDVHNDDQSVEKVDQEPPSVAPELMKMLDMLAEEREKVDRLQAELRDATNTTAHWQARAVAAEQTVQRLLPAPTDEPAPAEPEQRRTWWQRLVKR